MKKIKLKQGTRVWEQVKESRIGSSEVYDIVRYYATDEELHNCGFNAELIREELPFISAWALYHKILNDGIYKKPLLEPHLSEYGLAMESFGLKALQQDRVNKLKKGEVYVSNNLIASLDVSGISEEIDSKREFDFGGGQVPIGVPFVAEQKTISPYRKSLPLKYIIQAQYQISMSKKRFYVLQAMILNEDTPFERGKIVALEKASKKKFIEYVKEKVSIQHLYFNHNEPLSQLIKICLNRFFEAVENRQEPKPFLESDKQTNIIIAIRNNSFFNPDLEKEFDLTKFAKAKENADLAEKAKQDAMQEIIDFAKENNCSKFYCEGGYTASFSSNGRFLLKEPKEIEND